jgi:hypothetical protein
MHWPAKRGRTGDPLGYFGTYRGCCEQRRDSQPAGTLAGVLQDQCAFGRATAAQQGDERGHHEQTRELIWPSRSD